MSKTMKGCIKWFIITLVVIFAVKYGWQALQLGVEGTAKMSRSDGVIGALLIGSLLLNLCFIDSIVRAVISSSSNLEHKVLTQDEFNTFMKSIPIEQASAFEHLQQLSNILASCMTIDRVVTDTIKNEEGEETSTVSFDSIKSFAKYVKTLNDHTIYYINTIGGLKAVQESTNKEDRKL